MRPLSGFRLATAIATVALCLPAFATTGDTAIATLNVSGTVPAIMSVQARGLPGDLDLTPGAIVIDRVIGLLHFKYNESADINVTSSNAGGQPTDSGGTAYSFNGAFKVGIVPGTTCASVDMATYGVTGGVAITSTATNFASATAGALTTGIEEDCQLSASWGGTSSTLPLAGVYSMGIIVTMVAK